MAVYGTKSRVPTIAVKRSCPYTAPDQASHTEYASPVSPRNYGGRPTWVGDRGIRIVGIGSPLSSLPSEVVPFMRESRSRRRLASRISHLEFEDRRSSSCRYIAK